MLRPGQSVAGNYVIEQTLGTGVHGAVYLATHRFLGPVALKVFSTRGNEQALAQEARLLSQINHPRIVRVFDAGVAEIDEGTYSYLAMEYLRGGSLASYIDARGRLPVDQALDVAGQILMAVAHLSSLQPPVVHRDIIPENVLVASLSPLGVKVSDFSMAQAFVPAVGMTWLDESVIAYLPPEAALGYFPASGDLYAIGVILYRMLTGVFPFSVSTSPGPERPRDVLAVRRTFPDPPSQHRRTIAPGIDGLVLRALAPSPHERFSNAQTFANAIRDARAWAID